MARVAFTQNLQRHVECPTADAAGATVREVLDGVFTRNPRARSYVLDEQGGVRKHVVIFINGEPIKDRTALTDAVDRDADVFVMQALSGG